MGCVGVGVSRGSTGQVSYEGSTIASWQSLSA
jgi:hypothetical protein